jgi:hypothetical protein
MHLPKIRKFTLRRILRLASDIAEKLPSLNDSALNKAIKTVAVFDSIYQSASPSPGCYNKGLAEFFEGLDVVCTINKPFTQVFSILDSSDNLKITKHTLPESDVNLAQVDYPGIGTIYLIEESITYTTDYSATIYHTPGFDFKKVLGMVWAKYCGRIHISRIGSTHNGSTLSITQIPEAKEDFFGKSQQILKDFQEQHLKYIQDNVPRTYLFCGKQGIGKTSFFIYLASLMKDNLLRIDANSLTEMGPKEMDLLLTQFAPNFLLIDDIDRAPKLTESLPSLFTTLAELKRKYPKITVALTANDINSLDPALLRPERIDEIIEMEPPDCEEREDILNGYLYKFGVAQEVDTHRLAEVTESLTAAYLQEIALQLKYRPQGKVLKTVSRMIELSNKKTRPAKE